MAIPQAPPIDPPARPVSLTRHYLRYLNANVLTIVAGLISFKVMTRLLPYEQYGIFGYFQVFILMWTALLKLGMQHPIQRLYPSHCLNKSPAEQKTYYTTLMLAPALISTGLFALTMLVLGWVNAARPIPDFGYLNVVLLIAQIGVLHSLVDNLIRAREMSRLASALIVAARYLELVLVIVTITWLMRSAMGVYRARLVSVVIIFGFMARWAWRHCRFDVRSFSLPLFKQAVHYGFPLVAGEIAFILLAYADHVMLRSYHGAATLGVYSIGYGLAVYVGLVLRFPLEPAFQPLANRLYETEGLGPTLKLQRNVLKALFYAAAAISVGIIVVGRDFFILIADRSKLDSAVVFQWVAVNYTIYPIFLVAMHGLTLLKRSRVIMITVAAAALLNVLLNLWLIPRHGVMGAVYATLASYGLMCLAQVAATPREYRPPVETADWLRPAALGGLMAAVALGTGLFGAQGPFARLAVMAALFAATFIAPALAWDRDMRQFVTEKLNPRRAAQ